MDDNTLTAIVMSIFLSPLPLTVIAVTILMILDRKKRTK